MEEDDGADKPEGRGVPAEVPHTAGQDEQGDAAITEASGKVVSEPHGAPRTRKYKGAMKAEKSSLDFDDNAEGPSSESDQG